MDRLGHNDRYRQHHEGPGAIAAEDSSHLTFPPIGRCPSFLTGSIHSRLSDFQYTRRALLKSWETGRLNRELAAYWIGEGMDVDRKALMPAEPPNPGPERKSGMSRRTAGWLMVVAGLLVVYHYAHQPHLQVSGVPVTAPALHVVLRGEVTQIEDHRLVVRVEDSRGRITDRTRTITLSPTTQYRTPGQSPIHGHAGLAYLNPGYRVQIQGLSASDGHTVKAAYIAVSFPPVSGTLTAVIGSDLEIRVAGQAVPMTVTANSHTAFYVPDGRLSSLSPGAPIQVWITPEHLHPGEFTALTVAVRANS